MGVKVSILIPTIRERLELLSPLLAELMRQTADLPVEILVLMDNRPRTTGMKRNELVELAQGEYITFLDDGDWVEPRYVQEIIEALERNPGVDCLVFDVAFYNDGDFVREPNQWMCWSRSIAIRYKFPDLTYGEDPAWIADGPWKREKMHQERVPAVLYHHRRLPASNRTENIS